MGAAVVVFGAEGNRPTCLWPVDMWYDIDIGSKKPKLLQVVQGSSDHKLLSFVANP